MNEMRYEIGVTVVVLLVVVIFILTICLVILQKENVRNKKVIRHLINSVDDDLEVASGCIKYFVRPPRLPKRGCDC